MEMMKTSRILVIIRICDDFPLLCLYFFFVKAKLWKLRIQIVNCRFTKKKKKKKRKEKKEKKEKIINNNTFEVVFF